MSDEGMGMEVARPQSAVEVKAQVNAIQAVMKSVMKKNVHFGVIPGCGKKPVLLKPGAEKIMATFRLAADPEVEDLSTYDESRYRIKCRILGPDGNFLGAGIGECSTNEEKYKWQTAIKEEFDATPEDRRRKKWKSGYQNKPAYQVMQVRTNPADKANTVLKMAKKRAMVDGVLTATAASDVFDQDLEEPQFRGEGGDGPPPPSRASSVKSQGQPPAAASKPAPAPEQNGADSRIVQQVLLDEIGAYCGGDEAAMKKVLEECSFFKGSNGQEKFLDSFANIPDKWAGSTLRKLRERVKAEAAGREPGEKYPADCTKNPESCEHSTWRGDKAFCGDKECEFGPF